MLRLTSLGRRWRPPELWLNTAIYWTTTTGTRNCRSPCFARRAARLLEGAFHGDRIEPGFAFEVDALGRAAPSPPQPWTGRTTKLRGTLSVDAPPEWKWEDHAWKLGDTWVGPGLLIAPDIDSFEGGYRTPGAFIAASATVAKTTTPEALLESKRPGFQKDDCHLASEASPFARGGYTGIYDQWEPCKSEKSQFLTIVAEKAGDDDIIYVEFQPQ